MKHVITENKTFSESVGQFLFLNCNILLKHSWSYKVLTVYKVLFLLVPDWCKGWSLAKISAHLLSLDPGSRKLLMEVAEVEAASSQCHPTLWAAICDYQQLLRFTYKLTTELYLFWYDYLPFLYLRFPIWKLTELHQENNLTNYYILQAKSML